MTDFFLDHAKRIMDTLTMGILVEDKQRNILFVNDHFIRIFNIPAKATEMIGIDCSTLAYGAKSYFKDPDKFLRDITDIPTKCIQHEEVIETINNRFFKRKYAPIISNENIECHVWSYEEVTAIVKQEQELINQKSFYNTVLNEIPADIAIFSPEHKYIYLNKTAIKNDELRKWILGKDDFDYCAWKNLDTTLANKRREYFETTKSTRQSVSWVDTQKTKEGTDDYVLRIFYPYINSNEQLEFVIGYGINITNQKKQELANAQQKERFKTLINTLKEGVFQIKFDGRILFYNESFLKLMKLKDSDVSEMYDINIMQNVHPDDIAGLHNAFEELEKDKKQKKGIFRINDRKTGTRQFIEYVIWYRNDDINGELVTGRLSDLTERVTNEENMIQLIEKEKQLNAQQSNFIHITTHELRTPLSVIMSSAEILELYENIDTSDSNLQVDKNKLVKGILKEVTRITDILNELLVVGRFENNKVQFKPEHTCLHTYVGNIVTESYAPFNDGRHLEVNMDVHLSSVYIDPNLMQHAITNLLNNAFKYSKNTQSPKLDIFKKNGDIHIQVTDYGIGIPESELNMIFNSFYRATNVGNISGTGIGLMVVDNVVKAHGGNITVKTAKNKGTTFTINIPDVQVN